MHQATSLLVWAGADPHRQVPSLRWGSGIEDDPDDERESAVESAVRLGHGKLLRHLKPDPTQDDFDELYTTAEIGWSPSRGDRYFKNFHVTAWYADERVDEEVPQSEGISFGANWTWCEQFMLFGRAGWSSGEAPLYNQTVTAGMLYYVPKRTDLLGLAVNWGDPADSSLDEQWTGELFYRFRLAQNVAITPSIQVVLDPALNPDEDELVIGSIRTRFSF